MYENLSGEAYVDTIRDLDYADKDEQNVAKVFKAMPHPLFDEGMLRNETYMAFVNDYTEDGVVSLTLFLPVEFYEPEIEYIKAGDVLVYGDKAIYVESVSAGDGYISLNEENANITLVFDEEYALWALKVDEDNVYLPYGDANVPFAENFTMRDHVNAETGEPVEEPAELNEKEFMVKFSTEQESENAIGYDIYNVKVAFDAEGRLLSIDRYYVVWQ